MEQLGAMEAAQTLKLLSFLFKDLKDIEAEAFIEKSKAICVSGDQGPTVGSLREVLASIQSFMQVVGAPPAKKAVIENIKNCFASVGNGTSLIAFSHQIKAALLVDVVEFHLEALEKSLGTSNFDAAYAALERDTRVSAPKLAEITTRSVSRTARLAPKRQMLQRIYARHAGLVDLAKKNEWQRGKSAA